MDNKIENNIFNETKEKTIRNICQKHNIKYEYYCIQCNNYYCSKCLIFFGEESNSHQKHFFLRTEKMNNLVIKEVINEYQKLTETKNKLEYFIELCNLKLKENIKKICELEDNKNTTKKLQTEKLDENFENLQLILNNLKNHKESIENAINFIPNRFNNILIENDHVQANMISEELKRLNKIYDNIEDVIKGKLKSQPKLILKKMILLMIMMKI